MLELRPGGTGVTAGSREGTELADSWATRMTIPPSSLHILINPASGQEEPILAPINRRLAGTSIDWGVSILKPDQEASAVDAALAKRPELLVVYGGDGTVAKIATRMLEHESPVPLAPLHGGTANALAGHLGVPRDLDEALVALCEGKHEVFAVDVGVARQHAFLLRLSVGSAADLTKHASREQKGSFGIFAYALSTLQAVRDVKAQEYRITVDGVTTVHPAIACIVANASGTGLKSPLASDLDESDAELDALLVPDMSWVARAVANAASGAGLMDGAPRRSGVSLRVECDEPMPVHVDGEYIGSTPVDVEVRHHALRLVRFGSGAPETHQNAAM